MTKNLIPLALLSLVFYACTTTRTEEKKVPVSYTTETLRTESSGGCASDTPCAYYAVTYPVFSGLDTSVSVALQKSIDKAVSMSNPEATGQTMKQMGDGFIRDFEEFKNDIPEFSAGWSYKADIEVEVLTDTLLSLSVQEEYYTGGAHGGHGVYYINIDPRSGRQFTLDNMFKPGYKEPLTAVAEKVFRQVRELPDTASLGDNFFEFPDDQFQLNENYGFKQEGIVFFYNNYEIAAYAAGPTELLIPYEELKDWLK